MKLHSLANVHGTDVCVLADMDSGVSVFMKLRAMTEPQIGLKSAASNAPTQINEFFSRLPEH